MKKICAWCKKNLGNVPSVTSNSITHGICPDCLRKFFNFDAQSISEFLERFEYPVFLVDSDNRNISANSKGLSLLKKSMEEIVGELSGDVFDCKHAVEGCGQNIHCKTCTIRKTVNETYKTGKSFSKVPAYPDLNYVTNENKIKFLISTEKKGEAVVLRIDEVSEEKEETR